MRRSVICIVVVAIAAGVGYAEWSHIQNERDYAWHVAYNPAYSAYYEERYADSAQKLVPILAQTEEWWPNSPRLFETLGFLGGAYRAAHNYDAAEPILKRALALSEIIKSADSTQLARVKFNLAIIARDRPEDVEAERLFNEALELFSKNPRAAQGDDAASMLNLGFLCKTQGRFAEAESYLTRSIASYEPIISIHRDLANAHFQLGDVYGQEGREAEAVDQMQRAVAIWEKVEGPNGVDVQHGLLRLAIVQSEQGKTRAAKSLGDRVSSITRALAESSGKLDADTLNNEALVAEEQHDFLKAEVLFQESCKADEQGGESRLLNLAQTLSNLGDLYRDNKQFDIRKAEAPLERGLAIREKVLGPKHIEVGRSLSGLSLLYFYERKSLAAAQSARRALPILEKNMGSDGLEVSTALNRLGIAERDLGQFQQAESDLKRALAIREKGPIPNQSWIAISLENLASVYVASGDTAKAEPLFARANEIRSRTN